MVSDSLSRKLTMLTIPPFMVGWGFYLVGLISELNATYSMLTRPASKATPNLLPFYISLIGGPFLIKVGLLHVVVSDLGGSILGAILAILSTIYFSSVGAATFTCMATLNEATSSPNQGDSSNIKLMLMGLILQGITWCFVLVFSSSYVYQTEEEWHDQTNSPRHQLTPRTLSKIFLLIAATSWCVFSYGLYQMSREEEDGDRIMISYSSFYTSVTLFLIHLVALLNVGSSKKTMSISIATSFLTMVYFYFLGDKLNKASIAKQECKQTGFCTQQHIHACNLVLGSGMVCLIFWGCSFALQPFYRKLLPTSRVNRWTKR